MGYAYNESYVEFGSKRKANFCDKVFTAWDFNITASQTAKLKRAHIRTDFEVREGNSSLCSHSLAFPCCVSLLRYGLIFTIIRLPYRLHYRLFTGTFTFHRHNISPYSGVVI